MSGVLSMTRGNDDEPVIPAIPIADQLSALQGLSAVLMALLNGLDGTGRFTSVLFPVFIALAMLVRSRAAFVAVCAVFVPFLMLFFAQFARSIDFFFEEAEG